MNLLMLDDGSKRLTIVIDGDPQAKKRPRFDLRGHAYNIQKDVEKKFRVELVAQTRGHVIIPAGCPIVLRCAFYLPIPKTIRKKDIDILQHTKKPDLDNLIKLVKDCCNEIIWHDDSQVVKEECEKYYAWGGKTQTIIEIIW